MEIPDEINGVQEFEDEINNKVKGVQEVKDEVKGEQVTVKEEVEEDGGLVEAYCVEQHLILKTECRVTDEFL